MMGEQRKVDLVHREVAAPQRRLVGVPIVEAPEIAQEGDRRSVAVDVELHGVAAPAIVAAVGDIDGVLEVRWNE